MLAAVTKVAVVINQKMDNSKFTKHFEHQVREKELYSFWESSGIFKPENCKDKNAKVFNIAMPPPNANGELHLGHSLGYTFMDILGRFHRLKGERVLLLPGKDHAGIMTQVVYEKKLKAAGIDHRSMDQSELYQKCYDFCIDRAEYMRSQEKQLGTSADWSKELFTLDPKLNSVIFETFTKLWNDGLVYKGSRIINWSVFSQTGISDVEVEYVEKQGSIWYIFYPFANKFSGKGFNFKLHSGEEIKIGEKGIVVATTRPETMLGDTAITVHPEDPRYQSLIGQEVIVPLIARKIKIIADARIDPEFGTGAVKVTPAHDFNDYEIGLDHKLEAIQVIGFDGKMTEISGPDYAGLTIEQCRLKVIEDLTTRSLLLDTKTITHKVPIGERGKDIIEPLISEQWFINVDKPGNSLKQNALQKVKNGEIKIYPQRFQVLFEQWLENLRDWNISRQLWWGHRLPVWYKGTDDNKEIYVGTTPPGKDTNLWQQETDTFDTWFSSGQWPFSTAAANGLLSLEKNSSDYFPSHTMVMGRDILFFWACRMLLLSVYRTGEVPWRNIFFTGLIRDEHGQKMSKSKGNGIEPKHIIEKYGTDTLRLALIMGSTPGNDLALSEKKFEGYSKFTNKLWNSAKLLELKLADRKISDPKTITLECNRWILTETAALFKNVTTKLDNYDIAIAIDEVYNFTWTVFCDWYLEMMKVIIDSGTDKEKAETAYTAATCFRAILKMLHPFLPYITEEIFNNLKIIKNADSLAGHHWSDEIDTANLKKGDVSSIIEIITGIRSVKSALNMPHVSIRVGLDFNPAAEEKLLISQLARVTLCSLNDISAEKSLKKPFSKGIFVCEVDNKELYDQKLRKELETHRNTIQTIEKKLTGDFIKFAKADVVAKEQERLEVERKAVLEIEKEILGGGV